MVRLILVRHAEAFGDDIDEPPTLMLAERLKMLLSGSVRLLSSHFIEPAKTAEVIGKVLAVPVKKENCLIYRDRTMSAEHKEEMLALVRASEDVDNVILVTHGPITDNFPAYFDERILHSGLMFPWLAKGQVLVIDCNEKTFLIMDGQ